MNDRNWEQELAKIDKQLASVSDEQLLAQNTAPAGAQKAAAAPSASAKPVAAAKSAPPTAATITKTTGSWMAWVQLTLAVIAAGGLWFWPWATRCGLNAIGFTAATGAVTALGLWSAIGSWRHRQAYAHVLSFAVMVWGLVLGAREVLPRIGYAIPTAARSAGWSCQATPAPPVVTPSSAPSTVPSTVPSSQPGTPPTGTGTGTVPPS